jgi:alkanesulfonate monooxygenase SsuD/methylene tetrahydromethanopterin reductase-like flavin-dependent oxidoreductase (luciferase family)
MTITFGLSIPAAFAGFGAAGASGPSPREWIEHLEVDGVEELWALDQHNARTMPSAEPMTVLSHAAALTTRVRLGVAVMIGPGRGPLVSAKEIATVDWLSRGRLDIGLGLGDMRHYDAYALDTSVTKPGALLDEYTELLVRLLTQARVDFDGPTWPMRNLGISPLPLQQPHPPLLFGGGGNASLRRAVRWGAGWIGAGRHSNAEFIELAARLLPMLDGRPFRVAKRVYIHVTDDPAAGARVVADWFTSFYGNPDLGPAVTVTGSIDRCAAELNELVEAGANHLLLHPLEETPDQYARVTGELIPQLR